MIGYLILQDMKTNKIINTYDDWGLILGKTTPTLPKAKTQLVNIEGGDGTTDLTEVIADEVKYENRVNKYPFTLANKFQELPEKLSLIANNIHGKQFKIIQYNDPNYYYIGRISVNDFSINKNTGSFTLEATCNPYKYKLNKTVVEKTVNGTETITLENERKRVVPEITTDSVMQLTYDNKSMSLSAGTFEYLGLYLNEGTTEVTVTGNGTIKFTYQEASL